MAYAHSWRHGMGTSDVLERAAEFTWKNARLLDRRRFAYHFEGGPAAAIVTALRAYQNDDGGFGHALEADLRAPTSTPIFVEIALHALAESGAREPELLARVRQGDLHVTAVSLLAPQLNDTNARELMGAARNRTADEIRRLLADRKPRPDVAAGIRRAPESSSAASSSPSSTPSSARRRECCRGSASWTRRCVESRRLFVRPWSPRWSPRWTRECSGWLRRRRERSGPRAGRTP